MTVTGRSLLSKSGGLISWSDLVFWEVFYLVWKQEIVKTLPTLPATFWWLIYSPAYPYRPWHEWPPGKLKSKHRTGEEGKFKCSLYCSTLLEFKTEAKAGRILEINERLFAACYLEGYLPCQWLILGKLDNFIITLSTVCSFGCHSIRKIYMWNW